MKRVISFILLATLTLCAMLSALPSMAATPEGTAIKNESDFLAMASNGKYYLSNDITITSSYTSTFKGTLDGNGKTIKIAEGANVSPFKKIEGATLKNLTVEGVINVTARVSYGGIAVEGYGSFENVTTRVGISAMVVDSFNSVGVPQGCFIARSTGNCSFTKCKNESSITVVTQAGSASNHNNVGFGGFIGTASDGTISFNECYNNASITSIEPRINVGGFVGASLNSKLSFVSCDNNAIVVGGTNDDNSYHSGNGGFIGTMTAGSLNMKNCRNIADVQTYGGYGHTGGCVGRLSNVLNLNIDGFKNMRAIYNSSGTWTGVGGLVGIISDIPVGSSGTYIFKDCINSGWVSGSMAGGIVGIEYNGHGLNITFEHCANTSLVKTLGTAYAGGIIGRSNGILNGLTFKQCLNTGEITTVDKAYGVGGIVGNIGEDQHKNLYNYTPIFEKCVNTGNIVCLTEITAENNVVAAGILSRSPYIGSTIKDCINLGTLSNSRASSNVRPITSAYNEMNKSNTVSGCSYLSGSGGTSTYGETAKSLESIRADVVNALTAGLAPEAEYYNYSDVKSAIEAVMSATTVAEISQGAVQILLNSSTLITINDKKAELLDTLGDPIANSNEKYDPDSYTAYMTAYEKIKSDINAADTTQKINAINITQAKEEAESKLKAKIDPIDIKKAELLEILGNKISNDSGAYTADSYKAYSDAYLAIKNIIDSATDLSVLNVLDVKTLKDAAEAKLVEVIVPNGSETDAPETDTPQTNDATETGDVSEVPLQKGCGGCGSSVALSALALTSLIGTALVIKKKD